MKQPFSISPESYARPLNVMGDKVNVLADSEATGGYAVCLLHGREGNGPPPHSHPWDEAFFVISGEVAFTYGGETKLATAGTLVHFPAGTVHSFTFQPGGAEVLEMTGAGTRAVEMFSALDREIPEGSTDGARIVAVLESTGVVMAK